MKPRTKRDVEQVIVANAEQLVAVASLRSPRLNRRFLDRYLVVAEDAELRSIIVFNKIDLVSEEDWRPDADAYEKADATRGQHGEGGNELLPHVVLGRARHLSFEHGA